MFDTIAWISLALAFLCAAIIAIDVLRHPQKMAIMNVVWPVTALYGSLFAIWGYFRAGRIQAKDAHHADTAHPHRMNEPAQGLTFSQIAVAASHCGAGCTLGDIAGEFAVFALALKLWGSPLWAAFLVDFVLAWAFGIVFQYFTLVPMRGLSLLPGIRAAVKADTLSIAAWQLGMFGWMLLTWFLFFPHAHLHPNHPGYWFMMQLAMIAGFFTACPMNYLLIRSGLKEPMA